MPVFRVERTHDYTVMSNFHLKDKRLSLKAKGLLSQMLSLPDDWDYTLSGLCFINRESKDAIRSAINELERAGYIRRRQTTDATGKFGSNEYSIYERPITDSPSLGSPSSEKPTTEKPIAEKPLILENIEYDYLCREFSLYREDLDEIVELIVETVCAKRQATRIAGSDFPHEVVRSRFLKLTSEHIRFVMDCMKKNTTDVRNMKQYLLTTLFNAPTTINNYYTSQVNHDMNAGGW